MIMSAAVIAVMKQIYKNEFVVVAEGCHDIRVREALIRHRRVIKLKSLIKVDFPINMAFPNSLLLIYIIPSDFIKNSHFEDSIIDIRSAVDVPTTILLNIFHFDVGFWVAAVHLVKCLLVFRVL